MTNFIDIKFIETIVKWQKTNNVDDNECVMFIADMGYNPVYSPKHNKALENLSKYIRRLNEKSLLLIGGDLVYDALEDINTQYEYFKIMFKPKCKYYSILGNHDYYQNPNSFITNNYFNVKDWYYTVEKDNMIFYMIDTCLIHPDTTDIGYKIVCESRKIYCNNQETYINMCNILRQDMLNWLDTNLEKNKDKINIIVGHYPIYTCGIYYHNNNIMMEQLFPILKKHNVKLYLSGHEHNTQHLILNDGDYNLNVIISGTCIDYRNNVFYKSKQNNINEIFLNTNKYLILKIYQQTGFLYLQFHDVTNDNIFYSIHIKLNG